MILRIPPDAEQALIYVLYAIVAVIIFLWGRAVGVNQTTEDYKRMDTNSEVIKLRRENKLYKFKNDELRAKNKFYLGIFSAIRHNIKKGE